MHHTFTLQRIGDKPQKNCSSCSSSCPHIPLHPCPWSWILKLRLKQTKPPLPLSAIFCCSSSKFNLILILIFIFFLIFSFFSSCSFYLFLSSSSSLTFKLDVEVVVFAFLLLFLLNHWNSCHQQYFSIFICFLKCANSIQSQDFLTKNSSISLSWRVELQWKCSETIWLEHFHFKARFIGGNYNFGRWIKIANFLHFHF